MFISDFIPNDFIASLKNDIPERRIKSIQLPKGFFTIQYEVDKAVKTEKKEIKFLHAKEIYFFMVCYVHRYFNPC